MEIQEYQEFLTKSIRFSSLVHQSQLDKSGEPYIIHPLDAALTVADLQLDSVAVAAALLHDVQEDCDVPNEELQRRFGVDVANLVDGATKLERITKHSSDPAAFDSSLQAENLRKMFIAMARRHSRHALDLNAQEFLA